MQDESAEQGKLPTSRGIYLLPNLLTTSALFAGFYAVVAAMKGLFDVAATAIFVAMVLDMFDGRVARMTNTQTAFGAEYDSLSDMVAFGIAPALVLYSWSLIHLGKVGWLVAFLYIAMTALRLARFNTRVGIDSKRYFYGLPCPTAAGVIAGMVAVGQDLVIDGAEVSFFVAIITLALAIFMVAHPLQYYSFKEVDTKKHVPFLWVFTMILAFVLVSLDPPKVLFIIFGCYALSGPILFLITLWQSYRKSGTT